MPRAALVVSLIACRVPKDTSVESLARIRAGLMDASTDASVGSAVRPPLAPRGAPSEMSTVGTARPAGDVAHVIAAIAALDSSIVRAIPRCARLRTCIARPLQVEEEPRRRAPSPLRRAPNRRV